MDVRGQEDVGFRRPACKSFCHLDLSPLNGQGRFPEINVMDKWFIHSWNTEGLDKDTSDTNRTDVLDAFPIIMVHAVQIEAGRL